MGRPARRRAWLGSYPSYDQRACCRDLGSCTGSVGHDRLVRAIDGLRGSWLLIDERTDREQEGSAAVESIFAILILLFLALGVVQVALSLYARNVVAAAAHEGARAAIERGRTESEAAAIAYSAVRGASGGLVNDLKVEVGTRQLRGEVGVTVVVSGIVSDLGPLPIPITLSSRATARSSLVDR